MRGLPSHAIAYIVGALGAIVCNLGLQRVIFAIAPNQDGILMIALAVGTAGGLCVKYAWDLCVVFSWAKPQWRNPQQFASYGLTGVLTTLIFWGFESLAWLASGNHLIREAGALIGLSLGYWIKFVIDRRFVFVDRGPPR